MIKAPDFTLKILNDNTPWSLHNVKEKVVMITFWTSWCPDSLHDLKMKQAFYEATVTNESIEMIMINVSGRDQGTDIATFIKRNNFTFPILIDEGTTVYDRYLCNGVPTTILVNNNHEIAYTYGERATMLEIMQGITNLLI